MPLKTPDWNSGWNKPFGKDNRTRTKLVNEQKIKFCNCGCGEKLNAVEYRTGRKSKHQNRVTAKELLVMLDNGSTVIDEK